MPIERNQGETRSEFVSRCVKIEMDNDKEQNVALAICLTYADEYFKSATASVSDNTWSTEAPISVNFKRSKILFEEDFDIDEVIKYKSMGYKVYVRSSRKIKKKDRKVWNRLKEVGLTEDNLLFGSVRDLTKKHDFSLLFTGEDPMLEAFLARGEDFDKSKVIFSDVVESIDDAQKKAELALSSVQLKFVKVRVVYTYEEIPGIPPAASGSRTFCKRMMASNKQYTIEEIRSLSNEHLKKMFANYDGLEPDVFAYRGGFYRLPGTLNTTPWCRHQWKVNVIMG
jgi:hypothetical protein